MNKFMGPIRIPQLLVLALLVLIVAPSIGVASITARDALNIPKQFNEGFVFFEEYGDNRPSNTDNPGPTDNIPMKFFGVFTLGNGSVLNTGPLFRTSTFFPHVMHDQERKLLLLHPGFDTTDNIGASVSYLVPKDGEYHIKGAFARANNFQSQGDGVDVVIINNFDATNPLFSANISSAHAVDADDPFNGTGVASFKLMAPLSRGDVVRFIVFSGPQGENGSFDVTALKATIAGE